MIEEFLRLPGASSPRKSPGAMSKLMAAAEEAKVALTIEKKHLISIHALHGGIDLQCELTRDKFESLTARLLARLLIPMREVALMSGINLAGESLNSDKGTLELTDQFNNREETTESPDQVISALKKQQQSGRKNAKVQKKLKTSSTRELNRLKSELGDSTVAAFPGTPSYTLKECIRVF